MTRARRISIRLCKPSIDDFAQALREDKEYEEIELRSDLPFEAKLFVDFERRKPPGWLDFLRQGIVGDVGRLFNVSNAAVLIVRREYGHDSTRYFACTFGYGRFLLNDNSYVRDFGLRVALNSIDPDELISLNTHTLEELPFHRSMQATRAATPSEFELDSYRDMLTSVTGRPTNANSRRITGTDALAETRRLTFEELGDVCDEHLERYQETRYQERFGWIDHLGRVRDPTLQDGLDELLVRLLRNMKLGNEAGGSAWVAPPEILNWQFVEGFWITGTGRRRNELQDYPDLSWYLDGLTNLGDVQVKKLKQHKIEAHPTVEDAAIMRWSVYRSLIVEMEHDGHIYVLINGTWYKVARGLVQEVDEGVTSLSPTTVALPPAGQDEHEPAYNARAASESALYLLDRVLVRATEGGNRVESCDLFHRDGIFVHVKWYRRGSADLSHLFAQGTVAATAFRRERVFRQDVRQKLLDRSAPANWLDEAIPDEAPDPSAFEVAFAVIAPSWSSGGRSLPFFAKLTLMRAARELLTMGYRVTLTHVPIASG